ncbi:hypothetical protein BDQ12DRAFT_677112 [Crucibulum laeve]|uniref:Uncharacterized protein n=1 Tax=Crucibulum laeve TaxID=68775 RepID=A0A5C3MP54_9AGAR|nr:hypothetical protein BDQ12DRAFT_677112 [Crucibulum laeve]
MDVDVCVPSFQTMRQFSVNAGKRARSPEAGSPLERPSKRLSLAMSSDVYSTSSPGRFQSRSTNSSRYPSEDLVQQAGGLSIDSPIFSGSASSFERPHSIENLEEDVDMSMEPDDNTTDTLQRPQLAPLQTSCPNSTAGPAFHAQAGRSYSPHRSQPLGTLPEPKAHPSFGPAINVLPPTPMTLPNQPSFPATCTSTPPPTSPVPMAISPTSSMSCINSPRKPRFTMGPRADCERCRLGTKGHWVHID